MFRPIGSALKAMYAAGTMLMGNESEATRKRALLILDQPIKEVGEELILQSSMFVPGGLQMRSMYKGARDEGLPGLAASIVRFHLPTLDQTEWEPATLPGRLVKGGTGLALDFLRP